MRGTIDHIKKWQGSYFFIKGDDGIRYYAEKSSLVDPMQYRYCAWKGNKATFDIRPAKEEGKSPIAINIRLDEVRDPNFEEKEERRLKDRENRKIKAERRKKNEDIMLSKELDAKNRGYGVQVWHPETKTWMFADIHGDTPLFTDYMEAKGAESKLGEITGGRFRVVKVRAFRDLSSGKTILRQER